MMEHGDIKFSPSSLLPKKCNRDKTVFRLFRDNIIIFDFSLSIFDLVAGQLLIIYLRESDICSQLSRNNIPVFHQPFYDISRYDVHRARNHKIFALDYLISRSNISRIWTFVFNDPFPRSECFASTFIPDHLAAQADDVPLHRYSSSTMHFDFNNVRVPANGVFGVATVSIIQDS